MNAIAPGKVILSGEHAVVYGKPALVMAVNRYVKTSIRGNASGTLVFNVFHNDKSSNLTYTIAEASRLHERLLSRYQQFSENRIRISDVLEKPFELIPFAFCMMVTNNNVKLIGGVNVNLVVDLPLGSGMGSSAATALSVLQATASYYEVELMSKDYYEYAMQCEKLCHGTPSGVDPYISLHGGFICFRNGQSELLSVPPSRFFLALTGPPNSSTGECVSQVRKHFANSSIWDEFERVTQSLQEALDQDHYPSICKEVRRNHQLLMELKVVPHKIKKFISEIEKQNGAAKISGAGSISAGSAGALIIFSDHTPHQLCSRHGYELLQIKCDNHGLRLL